MKNILLIAIFLILSPVLFGQDGSCSMDEYILTEPPPIISSDLCEPDDDYDNYISEINSYIPTSSSRIINVRVNIHVVQKTDGTGNWNENNPTHISYLQQAITDLNVHYASISPPLWGGTTGDTYLVDSKIRFILKGIYFHKSDADWIHSTNHNSNAQAFNDFAINEESELNIFFLRDPKQEAIGTNATDLNGVGWGLRYSSAGFVMMFDTYQDYIKLGTFRSWIIYPLLRHEIGHCLSLQHTRDNDYLDDTYFPEVYNWGCNPNSIYHCSNNIMTSYSTQKEYLSPKQIGKLNLYLQTTWRSRWIDNNTLTTDNFIVSTSIIWDRQRLFWGNLIINNGGTLLLNCKVYMPENANIVVNSGGKLIIDGGEFTNSLKNRLGDIIVNNGGYLELSSSLMENYSVIVKSGGTLRIKEDLVLRNYGMIDVQSGGYICIDNAANVDLELFKNVINIYSSYHSGVNTSYITSPGNCSSNPLSFSTSGNGSIVYPANSNQYIQNLTINSGLYKSGAYISVGSNVAPSGTVGPVKVQNGAELYLDAINDVLITGDFELQSGCILTIVHK